ncbi:hypothetical protein [Pseudonocardia sp. WMMC193]|uniref:hypothetical protein n=1 Tax=Pseudonocardia sp. WMMC193 TaxID=2911965 RepID=UPI001F250D85|nr:hypothetical protein [Pseudonocardia sp. WMMC193]MCF7550952.1 hypothetical protein [Pseudonocardia sp. WMMC193]
MPWTATGSSLKGPKGDQGIQGPQGTQGPAGADGGTTAHAARHLPGGADPITNGVPAGGAAGQVLRKSSATNYDDEWAPPAGQIVARGNKTSGNIGVTSGTEVRIMMIAIPVVAGRLYKITTRMEVDSTTADGISSTTLRHTFATGTPADPTTSSTQLDRALMHHRVVSVPVTVETVGFFEATQTGTLKVLASVARASSSGQITVRTDGMAHRMWAEDQGPAVAAAQTLY